ncbi:MAG: hypothetical protein PWQ96_820 [Clostridia bacterium]|jgi:hypothetical protein|nr:hypothetical protein [Clostridiales bacterium]MDK2985178.1 hypothetical protein [Clostridia bacterium]
MIDLKYHFATIAAIFLALGIGMVIGSTFIDNEFLLHEQERLIDRLEEDFYALRQQNQLVKAEITKVKQNNETLKNFTKELYPLIFSEKFGGYSIVVIKTCQCESIEDLLDTLKRAGIKVKLVSIDMKKLSKLKNNPSQELPEIAISLGRMLLNEVELENEYKNFVKISGATSEFFDTALIVGGSHQDKYNFADFFDVPLIQYFKEQGLNVIAGECSETSSSYLPLYQKLGICTVENLDTVIGQTALMLILMKSPSEPINFDVKTGAEQLVPLIKQ